jgi:hypothetical protein
MLAPLDHEVSSCCAPELKETVENGKMGLMEFGPIMQRTINKIEKKETMTIPIESKDARHMLYYS